jgi:alpha-D-xyloside xylohydrolase
MILFTRVPGGIEARFGHEVLRVETWGDSSLRVRAAKHAVPIEDKGALTRPPEGNANVRVDVTEGAGRLTNGRIEAVVDLPGDNGQSFMRVAFRDADTGEELLAEQRQHFWWPGARSFDGNGHGAYRVVQEFKAYPDERLYGMGQRTHGRLDVKGLSLDLVQRNGEVNIPFLLSSRGYGFLWNNPGVGQVDFAANRTRWTLNTTSAIDYWITAGATPAAILASFADAVGHAPDLPEWASGIWQSRLRYQSQAEILEVARGYRKRGWPLSVIVSDYFHWTAMGDWRFDPTEYPDPDAMMAELTDLGTRLMVSIWPTVSQHSSNYEEMRARGLLTGHQQGIEFEQDIHDKAMPRSEPVAFYDATNPAGRDYLWSKVKTGYFDHGVRAWWLDACEPELNPGHTSVLDLHAGPGDAVANIYPRDHAKGFYEHLTAAGAGADTVLLCRSAWAGQAQYAAAVWSGDIPPTWESLAKQVRAGLAIGLSGIPWWTTDIGGFHGGDPDDEEYRELFARWFEYGTFCPLMRLHGHREPRRSLAEGGPNEPWSYGPRVEALAGDHIALRQRLRPYLHRAMRATAATGLPPMRPLFMDHPDDPTAWDVEDQFLLGPDLLVAPVTEPGRRSRPVYLPTGSSWTEIRSDRTLPGGATHEVAAPYEHIPVFVRTGAAVLD